MTYLSFAPQGLRQVLLTGGVPPIGSGCTADAVYRACFDQIVKQNEKYYQRFPEDIHIVQEIVKYLAESEGGGVRKFLNLILPLQKIFTSYLHPFPCVCIKVPLPSGGILTPRGLQLLGLAGLGSSTGFERLHYM